MPEPVRTNRLNWVDYARGMAILMVVYRHVVIGLQRSGVAVSSFMYDVQDVFVNFRMPLFFVLSGVFVANSLKKRTDGSVVKDRAATLLYPYILWGLVTMILQILFSDFANQRRTWSDLGNLFAQPRDIGPLWYLLALFNTSLLYILLRRLIRNQWIHVTIAAVLHLVSVLPDLRPYSLLTDLCHFYTYFYIGTLISAPMLDPQTGRKILATRHLLWVIPVFAAGQYIWYTNRDSGNLAWTPAFLLINLVGCLFIYILAYRISQWHHARWLAFLGRYSLYIYILHIYIAAATRAVLLRVMPGMNAWLLAAGCIFMGVTVPILIYRFLGPYGAGWLFSLKQKKAA